MAKSQKKQVCSDNAESLATCTRRIVTGLMEAFEPLVAALKENPRYGDAAVDTGQDPEVDRGLVIFLDQMIRGVYRQTYGKIVGRNGQTVDNAKDRLDKSQERLMQLHERYKGDEEAMTADNRAYIEAAWFRVNEARFVAYSSIFDDLCRVYANVTGETWEYKEFQPVNPVELAKNKETVKAAFAKLTTPAH